MQKAFEKIVERLEEKIKVTSLEIIVTGTKDKPYFEIKYKEVGEEDYHIGYSSYDLNNVLDWKEECFEIVNQVAEEYKRTAHFGCNTNGEHEKCDGCGIADKCQDYKKQLFEMNKSIEHINCSSDDLISRSVLNGKLRKWKFANEERGYDTAKDLVQEMIDLVKEQPSVSTNDGWIPCEQRLPDKRDWYLAVFKEPDTDFVLVPRVADYLGRTTLLTTNEGWLIIDLEDEMHINAYYKNLVCIAWRELPEPYQPKGE